jgi:hypothetical protein
MSHNKVDNSRDVSLHEVLDRVLNKGVVINGDMVISVADIDLVYLGVKVLLTSVETMRDRQLALVKPTLNQKNAF